MSGFGIVGQVVDEVQLTELDRCWWASALIFQ